jgi:hypothetical protein
MSLLVLLLEDQVIKDDYVEYHFNEIDPNKVVIVDWLVNETFLKVEPHQQVVECASAHNKGH